MQLDETTVLASLHPIEGRIAASLPIRSTMQGAIGFLHKHFKCERGGACCTGSLWQGHRSGIPLEDYEIDQLAALLHLDRETFIAKHCALQRGLGPEAPVPASVHEAMKDTQVVLMMHPCPFYDLGRCSIHEQKPSACVLFPIIGSTKNTEGSEPGLLMVDLRCPGGQKAAVKAWKEWFSYQRARGVQVP